MAMTPEQFPIVFNYINYTSDHHSYIHRSYRPTPLPSAQPRPRRLEPRVEPQRPILIEERPLPHLRLHIRPFTTTTATSTAAWRC